MKMKGLRSYSFSTWERWKNRNQLSGMERPGIYVIAKSKEALKGKPFSWKKEIAYIGMTAGKGGLRSRLRQFDDTLRGRGVGHGGAVRAHKHHKNREVLMNHLYVAVMTQPPICHSASSEKQKKAKGAIYGLELFCLAEYICRHKEIPQFNDWARSPKR